MGIRFSGLSGSATRAFDVDVLSWENTVIAAGGTVSLARRILVDQTVFALKASGDWDNIDDLMIYAAENPAQGLVSLKARLVGVPVNSPAFTADRCVITDGVTQYVDTGFIPSVNATKMTGTDQMLGVYETTNVNGSNYAAGVALNSNSGMRVQPRNGFNMAAQANFSVTLFTTTPASDGRGLSSAYRTAAPVFGAAKNGVSLGTASPAVNTTALMTGSIYVGGVNAAGALTTPRPTNCGYIVLGRAAVALSATFYNALQTHMTAIGAAV